jgi:hypothetical protein
MATLPRLPTELVEMIAEFLMDISYMARPDTTTICRLRPVFKQIETKTFNYFAKTHFQTVQLVCPKWALETFVAISESRIAPFIENLVLGPEQFDQGKLCHLDRLVRGLREFINQPVTDENAGDHETRKMLRWAKEYSSVNRHMRAV